MSTNAPNVSPSPGKLFQNGHHPPLPKLEAQAATTYYLGDSNSNYEKCKKRISSSFSDKDDYCALWRWIWVIPRYALYRCGRNGFYTVFGSSRNNSFSLAGLLLGITLGMFVGFFLQGCGRGGLESWESSYEDHVPWQANRAGKYRYHSAEQDAGYEPRVISGASKSHSKLTPASAQPLKVIPPAGAVKLVRPYHLATELGIVHKVALAFIAGYATGDWETIRQEENNARNDTSVKEAQLVRLLHQLSALETDLERQFLTPDADALDHQGDSVSKLGSRFHFERGHGSFRLNGQSVVDGQKDDVPTQARVVGKVLYFVRADAVELATLLTRYFPRLAPLGPTPADPPNSAQEGRDVAALNVDDAPNVDDLIDDASFARIRRVLEETRARRRRRALDAPPQPQDSSSELGALLGSSVKIVALDAPTPALFVGAVLTYLTDHHVYDHENIFFGYASGAHLRLERFTRFVAGLRRGQPVYLGHPYKLPSNLGGTVGEVNVEKGALGDGENFCDLNAGFLLGQSEVLTVKNNLATCLDDRSLFEGVSMSQQVQHIMGTCVSQILQRNCESFANEDEYVASDYETALTILSAASQANGSLALSSPRVERFNRSLMVYGIGENEEESSTAFNSRLEAYFIDAELREVEVEIAKVRSELVRLQPHIPDAKDEVFFTYGVRPRTKPQNHFEVNPWIYFNATHSLLPTELDTVTELNEKEVEEVSEVLDFAKSQFYHKYPDHIFEKLVNGYKQHDLTRGIEYILDLEFSEKSTLAHPKLTRNDHIIKRCHVMRPTAIPKIVYLNNDPDDINSITSPDGQTSTPTIIRYIMVPVTYRDTEQALEFLDHYTSKSVTGFASMNNVRLLVVFVVLEPPSSDSNNRSNLEGNNTFSDKQNKALDPVKRQVAAIKKAKVVRNLGWFTLSLPATPVAQLGQTYVYDGSGSVKIVTAFAEKIVAKYGDDRHSFTNREQGPNLRGDDKRYINFVTLVPVNARLSASDFMVRAMGNTRRGYKVSFAIPFQRYDPDIAKPSYEGKPADYKPDIYDIKTSVGRYDKANWGIASFYLSDFMSALEKYYNGSNPASQPANVTFLANSLHYPPSLDVAELFLGVEDKLELFRYVEPFAVLEHSSTDLECTPSPTCQKGKVDCPVVGFMFAMSQQECSLRKYSNAGTNTQLAFRVLENQLGINMSQYETIMANKNKVNKYIGK